MLPKYEEIRKIRKKNSIDFNFSCYVCLNFLSPSLYIQNVKWSWSYGSWIYNYLYNQCLSPLKLRVRTPFMTRGTRYNIICLSVTCDRPVVFSWFLPQ